jgi:DeoR/GlpR family transcriptional regulator of sugar metabolism
MIVADADKFGTIAAHVVAPATDVAQLITDDAAPEPELSALRALGVEVVVV